MNVLTVAAFLKTDAAAQAAGYSGSHRIDDFHSDSDGRVAIGMGGHYSLDEVKEASDDLERVQQACDEARRESAYEGALQLIGDGWRADEAFKAGAHAMGLTFREDVANFLAWCEAHT